MTLTLTNMSLHWPGGGGGACPGRLCSCESIVWPECHCQQVCHHRHRHNHGRWCISSDFFRSIATIKLAFSRTIGYYFLRTYFPLIIIVFWWDVCNKILLNTQILLSHPEFYSVKSFTRSKSFAPIYPRHYETLLIIDFWCTVSLLKLHKTQHRQIYRQMNVSQKFLAPSSLSGWWRLSKVER